MEDISLDEIVKAQEQRAVDRAQARTNKDKGVIVDLGKAPARLVPDDSVEYIIRPVVAFDKFYSRAVHSYDVDTKRWIRAICSEHYREDCQYCKSTVNKSGKQMAWPTLMGLFHIYNLQAFPEQIIRDRETGEEKEIVLKKFVRRVELPWGEDRKNYKPFAQAAKDCKYVQFTDRFFKIKRVRGTGWLIPELVMEEEVAQLLGKEVTLALPPASLAYKDLSLDKLKEFYLSDFDNVKKPLIKTSTPATLVVKPEPIATEDGLSDIEAAF